MTNTLNTALTALEINTAIGRISENPGKTLAINVADVRAAVVAVRMADAFATYEDRIAASNRKAARALAIVNGII